MSRRTFIKFGSSAAILPYLIGCNKTDEPVTPVKHNAKTKQYESISLPKFSSQRLHSNLDKLVLAYENKGMKVSNTLLPPISESEIRARCAWFPGELPPEIISLYAWSGGQALDAFESEYPFWFRDNTFCSLERAQKEYKSMMAPYGAYPEDHKMLKYSFPIASFNGSFYVIPTKKHIFNPTLKRPVISVHEGIDVHFYSIESMILTCVDWVDHDLYDDEYSVPDDVERDVWLKHNPNIFKS